MYTKLRYNDRQIPIKRIHFNAVYLWLNDVWAVLNPLPEASDTYAKVSGLPGPVHGRSHSMSLLCWFYYILGQADDTCRWCFFPFLSVPTWKAGALSFQTSLWLHNATACWHLRRLLQPPTLSCPDDSGRVTSFQPHWFTHGRRSRHASCEGHLVDCSAVESLLECVLYKLQTPDTKLINVGETERFIDLLPPVLIIFSDRG